MKFFRKKAFEPDVRIITKWSEKGEEFYAPGALIEVVNGKGILRNVFAQTRTKDGYMTALLDGHHKAMAAMAH